MEWWPLCKALSTIDNKLDHVIALLKQVLTKENVMSVSLDALKAQVAATAGVEASIVLLLNGVAAQIAAIQAAGGSPAEFDALTAQLKMNADALTAAALTVPPAP